jgi:acyl-CoA thioester hydrolase
MGYVHHSIYALYLEEARTEILRALGISYLDLEDEGYAMPVRQMHFTFIKAGKYDDLITLKVSLDEVPKLRWKFSYEIVNQKNEILCLAKTEMFFINQKTQRPCLLPEKYMVKIKTFF